MQSNILVTGASGFIGTHLVYHLTKNENNHVIAAVRSLKPDAWSLLSLIHSTRVGFDIDSDHATERLKNFISYYDINKIYHLASQSIVSRARKDPLGTYRTNVLGTGKILEVARQLDVENILIMSSDKIYGEGMDASCNKGYSATEPYSSSKIAQELITSDYRQEYGLKVAQVRSCNVFGYDPYNLTRIVPNTITRLLNGIPPVIYNPRSLRQYIYVDDIVKVLETLITTDGPYNVASPFIYTTEQLICQIINMIDIDIVPEIIDVDFTEIEQQSMEYGSDENHGELTSMIDALNETITMFRAEHYRKCERKK